MKYDCTIHCKHNTNHNVFNYIRLWFCHGGLFVIYLSTVLSVLFTNLENLKIEANSLLQSLRVIVGISLFCGCESGVANTRDGSKNMDFFHFQNSNLLGAPLQRSFMALAGLWGLKT